jgi:hypothetical protein
MKESGGPAKDVFYMGTGCNFCSDTGYKDRIGIYELLVMTPEIKRSDCWLGHPGRIADPGGQARYAYAESRGHQLGGAGHYVGR